MNLPTKLILTISLIFVAASNSFAQNPHFSKSISIDQPIQVKTFKDSADLMLLQQLCEQVTNRVANLLTAYQQEYDFRFYRNYEKKRQVETEIQFTGKIIDRAEKNFTDEYWFYNSHLKADYFLVLQSSDTTRNLQGTVCEMAFTLEELKAGEVLKKSEQQVIEWLRTTIMFSFYITSQRLNPSNRFKDTVTFAIDGIFECKSEQEGFKPDLGYMRELTDLVNNAIIWEQTKPPYEAAFSQFKYLQNYLKADDDKKPCRNVFYCRLTYNHHRQEYYMDIDLMIDGEIMPIPEDFDHRLTFSEKNKYSYSGVGQYILGRVGLILWIYKENFIYE